MNSTIDDQLDINSNNLDSQEKDIQEKQNLLRTRERMLEVIKEKNDYKMKVIYCLLSLNILLLIIGVYYFNLKK